MKLSEKLEWEDLTLEERLYEVEAAVTEEYREVHKQAIAEWIAQLEEENEALKGYEHDTDGLSCWCRPTPIGDNVWVHKKWSEFLGYVKQLEDTYGSVGFAKTCMQKDQNKAIRLKEENEVLREAIGGAHAALTELEIKAGRTSRLVYLANKALHHALFTTPEDTPISDIPASP